MYFIQGDTDTLRAHARALQDAANRAGSQISSISEVAKGAATAGDGDSVHSLQMALERVAGRLQTVQQYYGRAADIVGTLATELDALERTADGKFRSAGSPDADTTQWFLYEMHFDPTKEPDEASQLRATAAIQLKQLADASPDAPPDTSFGHEFKESLVGAGKEIGNITKDTGSALWDEAYGLGRSGYEAGKFVVYDGTTQLFVNPKGWVRSWKGVGQDVDQIVTHPKELLEGLWDGIADPKLFDKDKPAWVIFEIVNILTAKGLGKALKSLGSLKDLDPEGLTIPETLEVTVKPEVPSTIELDGVQTTLPPGSNADLSKTSLEHILYGTQYPETGLYSGRHMYSSPDDQYLSSKHTDFPSSWGSPTIQTAIKSVIEDPSSIWTRQNGTGPITASTKFRIVGSYGGERIMVVVKPLGGGVVTAFPLPK